MSLINTGNLNKRVHMFFVGIASHAVTSFFYLFLLSATVSVLVFYISYYLTDQEAIDISTEVTFKQSAYNEMLDILKKNEEKFNAADSREYRDIFKTGEVNNIVGGESAK